MNDLSGLAPDDEETQRRALLAYASEFMLFVSDRGEMQAGVGEGLAALGRSYDEGRGRHIAEQLHPDDLPEVLGLIERARRTPGLVELVHVRARHADGRWLLFEARVTAVTDHPVLGTGAVVRVHQIGEGQERDQRADRFLSLAEALPLGILSADARSWVVYANHAALQLLDLPSERLKGQGWLEVVHAEDVDDLVDAASLVIASGTPQQATFRVQTGLFIRWATARFVPLGDDRHRTGWIATLEDVTDRRRVESQLAHRATHDPLTDLPNRTLLGDRLDQACARLRRDPRPVAVLFVDLDGFKAVNDSCGHRAGDEVLLETARRMRSVIRPADTLARLGGDEFVAVAEGLSSSEVGDVAERLRDVLRAPMDVGGNQVQLTASVGVAVSEDPQQDPTELLARADQDMYRAKRRQRRRRRSG